MLLVIDNFDSFTYNLVQYYGQLGVEQRIFRNNEITPKEAVALNPDRVLLSPGPCSPREAGVTLEIIRAFEGRKPIFGVCLGHQALGMYFGAKLIKLAYPMHGKTSEVAHNGHALFHNIPDPFTAMRYHSLAVEGFEGTQLQALAHTEDGTIMALAHNEHPCVGVQFHPELKSTVDNPHPLFVGLVKAALDYKSSVKKTEVVNSEVEV